MYIYIYIYTPEAQKPQLCVLFGARKSTKKVVLLKQNVAKKQKK